MDLKKTIKANIVKDYLYIDDILDNLVKTRNGKSSATLRFSTEDVETLNEADIDILERNIFGLGKKFRVETKIRVMEDRQDLMGLVDKMEKRKEHEDVGIKMKAYIERYINVLKK